MTVKIKQTTEANITKLTIMARDDGKQTNPEIARWIIAVSPTWRSKGYNEIIKELENIIDE